MLNLHDFDCPNCEFHFQADLYQIHDDGIECPNCRSLFNPSPEEEPIETEETEPNDSMDGDHESGLASAGFGTDESYEHNLFDDEN